MYGVSKIHIEPNLMMISVQDAEFKDNTMARYLQIFADTGVVVDMISQLRRGRPCPECSGCGWH